MPSNRTPRAPSFLLFTALLTLAPFASASPAATDWKWTAARVVDTVRVSAAEISPDGKQVLYLLSRQRSASAKLGAPWANIWIVPFEGGTPRQMTAADAEDKSPAWSPDGTRIAFLSARGDEKAKTRLWVIPSDGGEAIAVTDEKTGVAAFAWAPHGRVIAYLATDAKSEAKEKTEKEGKDWTVVDQELLPKRLWVVTVAGSGDRTPRPVTALGERSAWEFDWSPDGQNLVATVTELPRTDDGYMLRKVLVLATAVDPPASREIAGIVGKVDQVTWSLNGKWIGWRGGVDASDPFSGSVFIAPAGGGAATNITGPRAESVTRLAWLKDGRAAWVAVRGTKTVIAAADPARPGAITDIAGGGAESFTSVNFSADGLKMAATASTAGGPAEVYVAQHGATRPAPMRRITGANSDLATMPRGKQETIRWTARDGLEIEGVVIRPVDYPGRASYPLIVIAHGGPESQYLDGWNTGYATPGQALAERGYFVLYPNYRGSTGRGVIYSKADHRDLGGLEFTDVIDGVDWLASRHPIDLKRVGMTGGSYGGYFSALAATRYSERFAASVKLFGISNWISFLGTSDIPRENSLVHWDLWCYDEVERCWQASPVAHVLKAATPTLILQGEKDDRVPKTQSDELYAALKWKGVPVEYVLYPREQHGFRERAHQIDTFDRLVGWFEKYLKP